MNVLGNNEARLTKSGDPFYDRHHLFWPRRDYVTRAEKDFRSLRCAQVEVYRGVHDSIHWAFPAPRKPNRHQARRFIERHQSRRCSCFTKSLLVTANLLQIESFEPDLSYPCIEVSIDPVALELVRELYYSPKLHPLSVVRATGHHAAGICVCSQLLHAV